jgi:hypothetical protein
MTITNWVVFCTSVLCGFVLAQGHFAWGIVAGGLIVTVNFHLLYRSLTKSLRPPYIADTKVVLGKYYIRFVISGAIIFVLIKYHYVSPLGLVIGVSVVVASFFITTFNEIRRILFKEAV